MANIDPSAVHDPFAADDIPRTFIKPTPGGRPSGGPPADSAAGMSPSPYAQPTPQVPAGYGPPASAPAPAVTPMPAVHAADVDLAEYGLNPLVAAANRLLMLVPQLRSTRHVDNPASLRAALAQAVREFSARAAALGLSPDRVTAARYVLCTALDEAAADTPWGGGGVWAQHSLAAMFHDDVKGGEKVFLLMARFAEKPKEHLDVLELIYCALALGFEGRYRVVPNGHVQLEAVRDKLAQIIRRERGDHAAALSQHWQGAPQAGRAPNRLLPLAATAAVSVLLLVGIYLALAFSLASQSDPVYAQTQNLRLSSPVVAPVQPAAKPRLAQFLQSDIKAGTVTVSDEVDRSVVTIKGDGTFAPGSATMNPDHLPLMGRIGDALAQVPGNVLVTGHTDDQAMSRSARYPSNWHLSEARAKSVAELLTEHKVTAGRLRAEGRAEAEPVAPNDNPRNRALNRRVEVTLFVGRGGEGGAAKAAAAASAPR